MKHTNRWDVIKEIWKASLGEYVTTATIDRLMHNKFDEHATAKSGTLVFPLQDYGQDLYFSALSFSKPARKNENFAGSSLLFADLDEADPIYLKPAPTHAWLTSPGMYQAVWFMNKVIMDYDEWATLNKRMTIHTGADSGGWQGSKLLRVPGSANFKRALMNGIPLGRMVIEAKDPAEVDYNWLVANLPEIETRTERQVLVDYPQPLVYATARDRLVRGYWDKMGLRARFMLTSPRENVGDRSLHIVRTIHELLRHELSPETVFHLIWVQPWNKWRTDRHDPERLWEEVQLAIR